MSYAIICDARKGGHLGIHTLALVDRAKTKRTWWTSDDMSLILSYHKKSAAKYACGRLCKNNVRVVDFNVVVSMIREQDSEITDHEATAEMEIGWDGHK